MFVRDGAVTPGPSRKCDITFFVKGRPKSARQSRDSTVAARSVQSVTVPSSRVSRECRSPGLKMPDERAYLKSFCWVPDSCHRKAGEKFARTFRKSSRKRGVFLVFRDLGWAFGPLSVRG